MESYKVLIAFIIILLQSIDALPQAYKIKLQIKGAENKKVQLAYYQGENRYVVQSSAFEKNGKVEFKGNEELPTGIYLVIIDTISSLDILIHNEPEFSITANLADITSSLESKGSKENKLFFVYQKEVYNWKKQLAQIDSGLLKIKANTDSIELLKIQKKAIEDKLIALVEKTKQENQGTYFSRILSAMELLNPDDINYADPDLLRTPFYHNMIRLFIKKNINKSAKEIIAETIKFLDSLKKTEANYQYTLSYLITFYNSFYKNGINEVFVFLTDSYFLPDKANWLKPEALKQLQERRDFLAQGLPGMPAADLTLESSSGEYLSLHQIDTKMTLLYFWSVGCGHCTKSTQVFKDHYEKLMEKDLEIFAVNVDKDKTAWLKKIEEEGLPWINCYDPMETSKYRDKYYVYGSPLLIVIGQNKKILAVKNGENEIEEFVNQLIK